MNKKLVAFFSLIIILAFIGYIIYDATNDSGNNEKRAQTAQDTVYNDNWTIYARYKVQEGELTSVAVTSDGRVVLAGDSFVLSLEPDLVNKWNLKTDSKITSLAISGDTIFASTPETILLVSTSGTILKEWGPYEENSIITSLSADKKLVAFADAGNRLVFVLNKNGELHTMMGQSEEKFIIPSPYFDVALSGGQLFAANTGNRRIETWSTEGRKLSEFGEPGTAPGAFCGCCNPAHFAVIPQGFVTAEKGINRIKIIGPDGDFIEFVSSENNFVPSVPLDVASVDGKTIYAVNSADSTLYIFKHK
jgi:hypothetical protein